MIQISRTMQHPADWPFLLPVRFLEVVEHQLPPPVGVDTKSGHPGAHGGGETKSVVVENPAAVDEDRVFEVTWGRLGRGDGEFSEPHAVAVGMDGIYVADHGNHRIQCFQPNGTFVRKWGTVGSQDGE